MSLIHATTVSIAGRGVVIRGAPGSGKSELALRLIDGAGFGTGDTLLRAELVADDQTRLEVKDGIVWASAPKNLRGLIELRGQGFLRLGSVEETPVSLIVDLLDKDNIERLPLPEDLRSTLLGISIPRIPLDPNLPGATAVIRAVVTGALVTDVNQLPSPGTPS